MKTLQTLREARLAAGLTQWDLERATGIFQCKISREENGVRCLSVPEMIAVEKALNAEIDWIPRRALTATQQAELHEAMFRVMCKFGELETAKFTSRCRSLEELYQVFCQDIAEEPLTLPDHSRKE